MKCYTFLLHYAHIWEGLFLAWYGIWQQARIVLTLITVCQSINKNLIIYCSIVKPWPNSHIYKIWKDIYLKVGWAVPTSPHLHHANLLFQTFHLLMHVCMVTTSEINKTFILNMHVIFVLFNTPNMLDIWWI